LVPLAEGSASIQVEVSDELIQTATLADGEDFLCLEAVSKPSEHVAQVSRNRRQFI
jgi:hypothetical protein